MCPFGDTAAAVVAAVELPAVGTAAAVGDEAAAAAGETFPQWGVAQGLDGALPSPRGAQQRLQAVDRTRVAGTAMRNYYAHERERVQVTWREGN